MLKERTRWVLPEVDEEACNALVRTLGISPLLARLLVIRGLDREEDVRAFLDLKPEDFCDPYELDDMEPTVSRIREAISQGEKILVYGDYDVDGVSSTAIMIHTLRRLNASYDYYIPNRFTEGYGLNDAALQWAKDQGFSLVLTVDTGISSVDEAQTAHRLGLDLLITDHHEPPPQLPEAYTVMNPKKPQCTYPFPMLAGAGVALKLSQALLERLPEELLDVAALGTISDLVPLTGENRLIARLGLEQINRTEHPGLRALIKASSLEGKWLETEQIGFSLGPRINASGRLDSADHALQLLITSDPEEADMLAGTLNRLNRERQRIVKETTEEAVQGIEEQTNADDRRVLVVAGEGWHEGVIGIVASKLVERYYRPTVVLSVDPETQTAKGSARSIDGFDLHRALTECSDVLSKFGGHTMAAGMSMDAGNIESLRNQLNDLGQQWLAERDLIPMTRVDLPLDLAEASLETIEALESLAPFGAGNPSPVFLLNDVAIHQSNAVGRDQSHLKLRFRQGEATVDAIGFGWGHVKDRITPNAKANVVGELAVNEWNGHRKAQIMVKDLSVPHCQIFDWRGLPNRLAKASALIKKDSTAVVYFREETEAELEPLKFEMQPASLIFAEELESTDVKQVILYDIPRRFESLAQITEAFPDVERIFCFFGEEENGDLLLKLPGRDAFKRVYAHLFKNGALKEDDLPSWAEKNRMQTASVRFMLDVFTELRFLKRENRTWSAVEQPEKKPLEDSRLFQKQKAETEVATELLYCSYATLYDWLYLERKGGDPTWISKKKSG